MLQMTVGCMQVGWVDGWVDGHMGGGEWVGRWVDGWVDGWTSMEEYYTEIANLFLIQLQRKFNGDIIASPTNDAGIIKHFMKKYKT